MNLSQMKREKLLTFLDKIKNKEMVDIDNKKYFLLIEDEDLDKLMEHWDEVKATIKKVYIKRSVLLSDDATEKLEGIERVYLPECYFEKEMTELGID